MLLPVKEAAAREVRPQIQPTHLGLPAMEEAMKSLLMVYLKTRIQLEEFHFEF